MQSWQIQEAKARFSELLERCLSEGPQLVTRRGAETAVLIRVEEWRRLQAAARPSLKEVLLAESGKTAVASRTRGGSVRRRPSSF